jgi:hypothetical protein
MLARCTRGEEGSCRVRLVSAEEMMNGGLDADRTTRILAMFGVPVFPQPLLDEIVLYEENLP